MAKPIEYNGEMEIEVHMRSGVQRFKRRARITAKRVFDWNDRFDKTTGRDVSGFNPYLSIRKRRLLAYRLNGVSQWTQTTSAEGRQK